MSYNQCCFSFGSSGVLLPLVCDVCVIYVMCVCVCLCVCGYWKLVVFDHSLGSYGKCKHFAKHLKCILGVWVEYKARSPPPHRKLPYRKPWGTRCMYQGKGKGKRAMSQGKVREMSGEKVLEFWQTPCKRI